MDDTIVGTTLGLAALLMTATAIGLWIRAIRTVAIGSSRVWYIAAFVIAAGMSVTAFNLDTHWAGHVAAGLSIFVALFFFLTAAIGPQKVDTGAIKVGSALPVFSGNDEHGKRFDSNELAGKPVLIKFFRGHW